MNSRMMGGELHRATRRTVLLFWVLLGALLAAGVIGIKSAGATTTFTVTETGDDEDINLANSRCDSSADTGDQCTLRAAIEEANDTSGADTIDFDIDGTGAQAISPASELPTITNTLTIDGYTQAGASENTLEEGNDAVLNVTLGGLGAGAGADGLKIEAPDCTIRGLVIRNFDGFGVEITGSGATGNRIEGNFIGVNRDGITGKGNLFGVHSTGDTNTVGGRQPGSRNVISGNGGLGIFIDSAGSGNRIEGNYVGTTADGRGDLGNAVNGVIITGGADLTAVGGTLSGAPNHIAHNGGDGVHISGSDSEGNHILSNSIFDNAELGIDLAAGVQDTDGVTTNDTDGPSSTPNNLQNYPTIIMASRSLTTGQTIISGRLNSIPTQDFAVQCFLTDGAPASDHGEGSSLLDTVPISTNANGWASFSCESSHLLLGQSGQTVSATATNVATGDTSEFSSNRTITTGP